MRSALRRLGHVDTAAFDSVLAPLTTTTTLSHTLTVTAAIHLVFFTTHSSSGLNVVDKVVVYTTENYQNMPHLLTFVLPGWSGSIDVEVTID